MRSSGLVLNQLSSQRRKPCTGGTNSSAPELRKTGAAGVRAVTQKTREGSLGLIALLLCSHTIRFPQESVNRAGVIMKLRHDERQSIIAMKVIGLGDAHRPWSCATRATAQPEAPQRPRVCA